MNSYVFAPWCKVHGGRPCNAALLKSGKGSQGCRAMPALEKVAAPSTRSRQAPPPRDCSERQSGGR
eukprot:365310-Chlamydomonas_euryale.AAC.10